MRNLVEGLSWASGWERAWQVPTKASLFKARARLGPEPLEALFRAVAQPMATDKTIGAFYRGLRLMSIDGTTIDLADTEENEGRFGRPGSGRGEGGGAFPQVRVVGLGECGTHGIVAASPGPLSSGEATLARDLLPALSKGMLLLADRYYYSFKLWNEAKVSGAELLWRTKRNHVLPVVERLSDGSYLSFLHEVIGTHRRKSDVVVRVIEYGLDDPARTDTEDRYRLLTTLLDEQAAPAGELAALYTRRHAALAHRDDALRVEDPPARPARRAAFQGARRRHPGALWLPLRPLRHPLADARRGDRRGRGPGQAQLHPSAPGGTPHDGEPPGFFPLGILTRRSARRRRRSSSSPSVPVVCAPTRGS